MKKIDRETVQRILDAADIVEVVSDFVHLKRRGSSYLGLCPNRRIYASVSAAAKAAVP